jgi:hypothetical protein
LFGSVVFSGVPIVCRVSLLAWEVYEMAPENITDPDQIAHEVVLRWNGPFSPKLQELIVAALREYASQTHEHNSLCPGCCAFTSGLYEVIKKADAEGYSRGRKEGWDESIKRLDGIKAEGEAAGYRRACAELANAIEASVNLKGINKPSEALINCNLQAKHDAELCRQRGQESK